ncbi:MAG: hypothetical protein WC595_04115 [Candidatus Nanoarchaeia archaeon]
MEVLVFLARFDLSLDKIKEKIKACGKEIKIREGDGHLEVEGSVDISKLMQLSEVMKVVEVKTSWSELQFKRLKEDALKTVEGKEKVYAIKTKFYSKIPISAKSIYKQINPFLKHESFVPNETDWEKLLYIEFKKENNKVFYRVGYSLREWWEKVQPMNVEFNFTAVLENPSLVEEVSDFLRLCWIFKLPLIIVTQDKLKVESILKKAKEITKGIEYEKFDLKITDQFPKVMLVGFSKNASKNEKDLIDFFNKNNERIYLVFGDDKFGLTQEAREGMSVMFHLTPETKKPLRASHALSYILGLHAASKL